MPKLIGRGRQSPGAFAGALGIFGSIRSFMSVVKEVNFNEVRARAELPPRLLVIAATDEDGNTVRDAVFGVESARFVDSQGVDAPLQELGRYDAIVVADSKRQGIVDRVRREYPTRAEDVPVFVFTGMKMDDAAAGVRCRQDITDRLTDLSPSLGRHLPSCRGAAVKSIIDDTAKANAQFALIANIPAVIPIVGPLVAVGADLIVLTKNQVMMLFKIAAVHERDLRDQFAVMREVIPVAGAGFVWRTLAREATSFIPLAAGTVPKVVIAYVGTVVVGRGAEFFYRSGQKASKEQIHEFRRQAVESITRIPLPGKDNTRVASNGNAPAAVPTPPSSETPAQPASSPGGNAG